MSEIITILSSTFGRPGQESRYGSCDLTLFRHINTFIQLCFGHGAIPVIILTISSGEIISDLELQHFRNVLESVFAVGTSAHTCTRVTHTNTYMQAIFINGSVDNSQPRIYSGPAVHVCGGRHRLCMSVGFGTTPWDGVHLQIPVFVSQLSLASPGRVLNDAFVVADLCYPS